MKAQWYIKCDKMAERALKVVADGKLKFIPDLHVASWNRWLEEIR